MPRATSDKFSRIHQQVRPYSKQDKDKTGKKDEGGSNGTLNPLFNTEKFGQHILKNPAIAQTIVDKANLRPTDKVLEIGPGTGNLTMKILEKAKHVTAVEMDPRMAAELTKRVQATPYRTHLTLLTTDILALPQLPFFDVLISNTPYQISSPLVLKLISAPSSSSTGNEVAPFRCAVLMFQHEFAARLVARPSSALWSRLSANVQLYAKTQHLMKVGKNNFRPPPKVESDVVKIELRLPRPPIRFEEFDGLNRIIFSRRNKTVHANFTAKGVMEMCEKNWRTVKALKEEMDVDRNGKVDVKALVGSVLKETGYGESRAAKMDVDDILKYAI